MAQSIARVVSSMSGDWRCSRRTWPDPQILKPRQGSLHAPLRLEKLAWEDLTCQQRSMSFEFVKWRRQVFDSTFKFLSVVIGHH